MNKIIYIACAFMYLAQADRAGAHGFVGQRFFPTTIAVEDPFSQDELTVTATHIKEPGETGEPSARMSEVAIEYAKRITPKFAVSVGTTLIHSNPVGEASRNGSGNLEVGGKWQFFTNGEHEAVLSAGLSAEIGDTGNSDVGAESASNLSPSIFFGKGFGDAAQSLSYLKPLAITGALSADIPVDGKSVENGVKQHNSTLLNAGVAVFYDLHYLQTRVKHIALPMFINKLVPVVEVNLSRCLSGGCSGEYSGTINPGVIWFGRHMQLGVEAQIPVNNRTAIRTGVRLQLHFFIDDLMPHSLGKPIFGKE